MPVKQLRRMFHTPAQINTIARSTTPSKTHTIRPEADRLEVLRSKVNGMSALVARAFDEYKRGVGSLDRLKKANEAKALAISELEAFEALAPCATQGARKALYQ